MEDESNPKSIYFLNTDFTGVIKETITTAASFQKLEEDSVELKTYLF